jgi:hypothetical protein
MPVYNATPAVSVFPGAIVTLWNAEQPAPGNGTAAATQQVAIVVKSGHIAAAFAIDAKFSAAPGAFEVDVQAAAVDADTNYQTVSNGNITTVDATNNTFHFDGSTVVAKFIRLLMRSRTNAVNIAATITSA